MERQTVHAPQAGPPRTSPPPDATSQHDPKPTRHLLALNGGLLILLAALTLWPEPAIGDGAQPANRGRGAYTMVAGALRAGNASGVWITDSSNQEVVLVRYDHGRNTVEGMGYRSISADDRARTNR